MKNISISEIMLCTFYLVLIVLIYLYLDFKIFEIFQVGLFIAIIAHNRGKEPHPIFVLTSIPFLAGIILIETLRIPFLFIKKKLYKNFGKE